MHSSVVAAAMTLAACGVSMPAWAHPQRTAPVVQASDASKRLKLQPTAQAATATPRSVQSSMRHTPAPQTAAIAATSDTESDEPGRGSYGMLVATLVLMGAIAVRRYRPGKS